MAGKAVLLSTLLLAGIAWSAAVFAAEPGERPPPRPIHIQADTLTYQEKAGVYHGTGHVVVIQGPLRLDADDAVLDVNTGQLAAVGHVRLNDGIRDIHGDRLDLNINTSKGVIFHGRIFVVDGNLTLDGRVIERLSESQYRVDELSFTTCDELEGGTVPWRFNADYAEFQVDGYLYARQARFCILDIPVMYLPVLLFPSKRDRATGLLTPTVGYSQQQGFKIRQAFFWAISPSQDATIALDYRGQLGVGGDLEYRYIWSQDSEGRLLTRYFHDTQNNVNRSDVLYRHFTRFSDDLQGRIDVNYTNQDNNYAVLSENVLQRVATFQESQAYLTQRWDNQILYGLGRYSQNLTFSDKTTVQTLPEIGYDLLPVRLGSLPLYGALDTSFDSFYRQQGIEARRIDLYPRLSMPIPFGRYFTVTPVAGFRETFYSRSADTNQPTTREVPYLSTSLDTRLVRRFQTDSGFSILHKIEPAVIYEYLPASRQSEIPFFNDLDRLEKKNLLTYRLTNRLSTKVFDGETIQNLEFAYFRLTQSEHLTSSPTGKPFSDLRGELILRTLHPVPLTLDIDTFYDYYRAQLVQLNTDLTTTLLRRYFLTVGERLTLSGTVAVHGDLFNPLSLNDQLFRPDTTHFYFGQFGVALPLNLYFVTRGYYDARTGQFPEVNYGVFYVGAGRCWGVGAFFIQRPGQQSEYAFVATLGGVGYSDSPFSALYRSLFSLLGLDVQKLR